MLPFEREVLSWAEAVWQHEDQPYHNPHNIMVAPPGNGLWQKPDHPMYPALVESISRLRAKWSDDELTRHAADVHFIPDLYYQYGPEFWKARILYVIAATWLFEFQLPTDLVRRVEDIVVYLLKADVYPLQMYKHANPSDRTRAANVYINELVHAPDSPELFDLLERVLRGGMLQRVESDEVTVTYTHNSSESLKAQLSHISHLYRMHLAGRVDDDLFAAAMHHNAHMLNLITSVLCHRDTYTPNLYGGTQKIPAEFFDAMRPHADRLAEDLAVEGVEANHRLLKQCKHLMESKWLLRAADLHVRQKLKTLQWDIKGSSYIYRDGLETLAIHLAQADLRDINSDEKHEALIAALRQYPAATLKALLPIAKRGQSRDVLLAALDWEDCTPLVNQLVAVSGYVGQGARFGIGWDIANSPDPRSGVLDLATVRKALDMAGDDRAREIYDLFRKSQIGIPNTLLLFEAVAGWNADKIIKALPKRNQRYIKAYGLLPLTRGQDEVLERYLFLKQYSKESAKFGQERQTNERAAAAAALANLAQIAGYDDPERLEWQMESHLAESVVPIGRQWIVDDYTVELALDELSPELVITRDGKTLKSVPKPLRQHPTYEEMKEAKSQLTAQFRRFRAVFERAMALGECFSPADLETLNRMPAARALLSRLIVCTDDLTTGLYLPDQMALETLSGKMIPITTPVKIAHPYHLFHAEELAPWQQAIVHRRIVQPFKQAFRELYLLTPAEQDTRLYSARFANHAVQGATAARLFQARGWEMAGHGDCPLPRRYFRAQGVEARFRFRDVGHYFSEERTVTSGNISFHIYPNDDAYRDQEKNIILIEDVPPLIFSEVMRDADLVVSVAQGEKWSLISTESYRRRGELITTLLDDLGLPGVSIEDHFAYVQGKLARYRVHLGSAVIHIVPGNYLCIVPDRWGKTHERLFLPFTDTEDGKMSEVISKIFLLLADDKIKDESILRQIRRQTEPAPPQP